jgi:hypothetical protein
MSIPVPLTDLRVAVAERGGQAYLLTVSDDLRPHAVRAPVRWQGDVLVVDGGAHSTANAAARPSVSLLCPARRADDYSLIIDGTAIVATADRPRLLITPSRAVLHRRAARPDPAAPCGADCVPLLPEPRARPPRRSR